MHRGTYIGAIALAFVAITVAPLALGSLPGGADAAFDREVREAVAPSAAGGVVEVRLVSNWVWGRPLA